MFFRGCFLCGWVCKDCEIGHLFAKIGAHLISENISQDNFGRFYNLLLQCSSFEPMKLHYQTLQWNCLQYQQGIIRPSVEIINIQRKCSFCNENYGLPENLSNESAEVFHILTKHADIDKNVVISRYLVNSNTSNEYPFLNPFFDVEKKPNARKFQCSKCLLIFKEPEILLNHGKLHLENSQM